MVNKLLERSPPDPAPRPTVVPAQGEEREEASSPLPPKVLAYVFAVFAAGAAAIIFFAPRLETSDIPGFVVIGLLAVVAGRARVQVYGETATSVGMVGDFAVAFLFGPAGAVIVSPFAALATDMGRAPWYKLLFNAGLFTVTNVAVALLAWGFMGGGFEANLWLVPITIAAVAVYYGVNNSLLAVAVSLSSNTPLLAVWREKFGWLLPHFTVLGLLGVALAVAYDGIGFVGVLAFIAPPLMMRVAVKQYIDRTAENVEELKKTNRELRVAHSEVLHMADELRDTYDGTLEALVSALDARDRETKGHSVRVAKYMMEIAGAMGIETGTDDSVDMQRGALLHDVGKIGVSDTILHKPGPLTDEEWVHMRRHPKIGHDMLRDIGFLSGAAQIVMAHHERFDGKGYPKGLVADEIPVGARIFVIADTFDAMTSDRPYRRAMTPDQARDEVIKCSGTQFDPHCVQAFLVAFDRIVEIRMADHDEGGEHHASAAPRAA